MVKFKYRNSFKESVIRKPLLAATFLKVVFFLIVFISFSQNLKSQTRTASVSGDWSNTTTWGGQSVPTSANDVVINDNINVTVDIANAECASLTINGGGNTSSLSIGANSLNVSNGITINIPTAGVDKYISVGNGSLSCASVFMGGSTNNARDSYISITGSGSVNVSGDITMNGSNLRNYIHFSGTGTLNIGGAFGGTNGGGITSNVDGAATAPTSGTVNFYGSGNQTIPAFSGYYNLTASNSGTKTLAAAPTVNRNLSIQGSAILNSAQFNITGNAAGTMTMETGSELILGNPGNTNNTLFPSNYTKANISLHPNSTVTYCANVNQDISGTPDYGNLKILSANTANRTRTLQAATLINGNLTIEGGTYTASLLPAGQNITVTGNTYINNNGIFNDATNGGLNLFIGSVAIVNGGQFLNSSNSVTEFRGGIENNGTFTKSGTGTTNFTVNSQFITGSNVLTFSGGDFVIANPASLEVSNSISFSGTNFTNNSNTTPAFNQTSGTFTFVPNAAQNIIGTGSGTITFYNLTMQGGNTKTTNLDFTVGNNFTVTNPATFSFGTALRTITVGGNLSGSGAIAMTGTGLAHRFYLGGTNNAIASFTTTAGSGSTVYYNRAGDQQVIGGSYQNLVISGSGVKTILNTTNVASNVDLQSGNLALSSYVLNVAAGATITSSVTGVYSNTNMIVTDGTGFIRKYINTGAPEELVMVYPVGTGNNYTPLEITSLTANVAAGAYLNVRTAAGTAGAPVMNPTDLNKYWYTASVFITSVSANINFTYIDPDEVRGDQTKYALSYSVGATWTTPASPSPDGANPLSTTGASNLTGFWTARENLKTLYSYQTGNWNDAGTWTTDPSGTLWQGASVPVPGDRVVVLNGRKVTVTNNNNSVYSLTVNNGGILDLGSTTGHDFGSVAGQGLIRLSTANMPGGTYDNFMSSGGGTVEYYNSSDFNLAQLTYNNLIFNLASNSNIAYLLGNLTVNGNLTIQRGNFRINNNSATTRLDISVLGDVLVESEGLISLGSGIIGTTTADAHRFTVLGNFTNNGDVRFTNLAAANYLTYPNHRVEVIFNNPYANQNVIINGYTRFYRIEIDKGIDQTYILNIDATASNLFYLFGRNNLMGVTPAPDAPNINNLNALGLNTGTVRLGANITIPSLAQENNTGDDLNYHIDEDACLWIDGADVTHTINSASSSSNSFVLYGKLKITNPASSFNINNLHGIVMRATAAIEIEDGALSVPCIRTSTVAGTHRGSYKQSGGTVTITGNVSGSGDHASFSFTYPSMSFSMSGGNLDISQSSSVGGNGQNRSLVIGVNQENISVTGGTVTIREVNRNTYFTSTAPFWNLIIDAPNATYNTQIVAFTGSGSASAVTAQPLVVLNDFSLENSAEFIPNNLNVTIGGDFTINTNSIYTPGINTTTLNGTGPQSFNVSGSINGNLNNLTLAQSADVTLFGNNITVVATGTLTLGSGTTLRDNGRTITVQGNIINSGTHFRPVSGAGSIILTGTNAQVLSGDGNGIFNNLTLNKTGGSVTTTTKFSITGDLRLANTSARLNIGKNNLHFTSSGDIFDNVSGSGKTFNNTKMILTGGLESDAGVSKEYSSTSAFLFPVGINIGATYYYNPASVQYTSAPTTYGTVTTRPVNGRHPLLTNPTQAITCYWKTTSSGFSGVPANTVNHSYFYDAAGSNFFVSGTEANYVPGVLLNGTTWAYLNNTALVADGTNEIQYTTASAADGEFTAGATTAFGLIPTLYSSSTPGNWGDASSWSSVGVNQPGGDGVPGDGTLVIIGDDSNNHTITITANGALCGSLVINNGSTLDLQTYTGHNFAGMSDRGVLGNGTLRISSATFPSGDFGDFIGPNGGTVEYYTSNANITIPLNSASGLALTTYNHLKLTHSDAYTLTLPNQDLTVYGDMTIAATGTPTASVRLNATATRTVTINGNLVVNSGLFEFRTPVQNLKILGDVLINGGAFQVQNNAGVAHTLEIQGNLVANSTFDMSIGTGYVNTYFRGTNNASIIGSAATIDFYRLYVDKGTNTIPVLNLTTPISVSPATGQLVYLQNGTFRINSSSLTLSVSAANTNFEIPSTTCLSVLAGTCRVAYNSGAGAGSAKLLLNGKLEVLGGSMLIGNTDNNTANDIEYASGGNPTIDVQGGQLVVAGQVRRGTTISTGSLNYLQSNGDVIIYGNNAVSTRSKFEILNSGSSFVTSGGTLTILNGGGGVSFGDLYLVPETHSVTGGTINLGDNSSASGQTFNLFVSCPVYNLTLGTAFSSQVSRLNVYKLDVYGNLTINSGSEFMANSLDVTLKGNLVNLNSNASTGINVGGYQAGSFTQNTIFDGTNQFITGSGSNITNFGNLTMNSGGTLSLSGNTTLRVNGNLNLNTGTLITGNNNIFVIGDVYNSAVQTNSTTAGGVVLFGSTNQTIRGNGSGVFGNVVINNSNDVNMLDNSTINGRLTFTNGRLYIDDYELTFGPDATTFGPMGTNRMIVSNGALSDRGVKKLFNAGATAAITLPIGVSGKYTPVTYTVNATSLPGSISVRPVNSAHPSLSDASGNELAYYWSVDSTGFGNDLNITYNFTYQQTDVSGVETSYVIGKYDYRNYQWINLGNTPPYSINTTTNQVMFDNVGLISGEFTVGHPNNFATVQRLYSRNSRPDNNWFSAQSWTTNSDGSDCSGPGCTSGYANSYPIGNPAIILPGHTIILNANSATTVSVEINGELDCSNTVYHSLGHVFGTGKISISSTAAGMYAFPGGSFDEFFETPNTTLEFYGANTATLPLKPGNIYKPYQNVIFSGTGRKDISYENLRIEGNLTIEEGTVLYNANYNKDLYVLGNWTDNNTSATGGFTPGTGHVYFIGNTAQTIFVDGGTTVSRFYNFTINNPNGLTLNGAGRVMINRNLYLTSGNIVTNSTNLLILSYTSTSAIVGGSASSYIDGPLQKNINNGQSFVFPVGSGSRYGRFVLSNTTVSVSPQYWTVTYFDSNPNPAYPTGPANLVSPISDVSNNEYWLVERPAGGTANVTVRWDENSYPAFTGSNLLRTRLRVVEYESATTSWTQRGSTISGNATSGTVSTSIPVTNNDFIFTLGLIGVSAGIITPPTEYEICDNGDQASIQVALSGTPPWSLSYQTVGNSITRNFTQPDINTSPYTIHLTASDVGGYGVNPYTLSLTAVSDASGIVGVVNPITVDIDVKQTYIPTITGASAVGSGEIRNYSTTNHVGSNYLWEWFGSSGGSIATPSNSSSNITFNAGLGTFQLSVTETFNGCAASATLPILVSNTPTPDITPKTANLCIGSSETYSTTYNAGNEYRWTVVNGDCTGCGTYSNSASISVTWNNTGDASVTVDERIIASPTVVGSASQNYYVSPMPLMRTALGDEKCVGQAVNVTLQNSETGINYQLVLNFDGSNVGSAVSGDGSDIVFPLGTPATSAQYYIEASNEGCTLRVPSLPGLIDVIINPLPVTGPVYRSPNN